MKRKYFRISNFSSLTGFFFAYSKVFSLHSFCGHGRKRGNLCVLAPRVFSLRLPNSPNLKLKKVAHGYLAAFFSCFAFRFSFMLILGFLRSSFFASLALVIKISFEKNKINNTQTCFFFHPGEGGLSLDGGLARGSALGVSIGEDS